jgi:hypothetical protein
MAHKRKQTGDYRAEKGYQRGYGAKITDLENLESLPKHGSQTQAKYSTADLGRFL